MYKYNVTLGNHFKNAWRILIYLPASILLPVYLVYRFGPEDVIIYYTCGLFFFLIFFIPQFILYLKYFFFDQGKTLYYLETEQRLFIKMKEVEYGFFLDDNQSVIVNV